VKVHVSDHLAVRVLNCQPDQFSGRVLDLPHPEVVQGGPRARTPSHMSAEKPVLTPPDQGIGVLVLQGPQM
jgi:hypothetical protein